MIFWWVTLNCTSDNTDQIIQIFNLENEQEIAIVMKIHLKNIFILYWMKSFIVDMDIERALCKREIFSAKFKLYNFEYFCSVYFGLKHQQRHPFIISSLTLIIQNFYFMWISWLGLS